MRKKITLALLSLLLVPLGMMAQNVTVHPGNGSMLPTRKTGGGDTFYNWGGFATWKHEQLTLTMTAGDSDNNLTNASNQLTASGQLTNHANDIFATGGTGTRYLQLGKGNNMDTYLTIALPKGYRFTGYTITFHRISRPNGSPSTGVQNTSSNISFGETNNGFTYRSTTNTTTQNITTYRGGIGQNTTTQYTIGRTSQTETDMDNVLYFRLNSATHARTNNRAFIQFDHIELYFTAEADYAPVTPTTSATERSAVDISFTTSKMDYGQLHSQTDGGSARISYDGTIHDLNANLTLYEDGSVTSVTNNGFDGTAGYIVDYKAGSISSAGNYFMLESSKHGNPTETGEAIYYLETPIWVTSGTGTNAHRDPIGYRIVGATFDYAAGTDHTYYPATFYIRYESTGHGEGEDGTYGLNYYSGQYNWNYQTVWRIDEDGYIFYGTSSMMYYLEVQGTSIAVVNEKPSADAGTFEVVNNQIRRKNYPTQYIGWEETETINDEGITTFARKAVITESEDNRSYYDEQTPAGGGTTGKYTLRIYDPTGTKVIEERVVEGTGGSVTVSGYNNDAIKIGIVGTGLVNGHLTLQALDPYIDKIDIVCQESSGNGGKLTQQFTATDFSVRGGKFTFYVPEDFNFPVKFTFENLYSHYGDNTYYNANNNPENHARYFFLGSTYAQTADNVYDRDAANSEYEDKVNCLQPGTRTYRFNNASTVTTGSGGYYQEYPFSVDLYEDAGGTFEDFMFSQTEMTNGTTKTAYLFTCDETRYNIAPTTAIQHVYYAYYEMEIDMKKQTYQPQFTWEKVYAKDNTFYSANNTYKTDAMFGLRVTTQSVTDDQGTHSGYVTVSQIKDNIASHLSGGNDAPSSMDQILYIDASNLMSIVENQTTTSGTNTTHKVSELKTGLAANALIYLPYGSKSTDDNFAYNTIAQYGEAPIFRGASNIVLTDKNPFFAKYGIQLDATKSAKYTRQITKSTYTDETYATVIMPFEIALTKGQHVDNYGTLEFLQMNETEATSDSYYNYGPAAFFSKTNAEKVEANTPYALHVVQSYSNDGVFTINQPGAVIIATPATAKEGNSLFSATPITATGNLNSEEYTFSHKGSFSGFKIPKTSPKTFYFANGGFYSSAELKSTYTTVDLLPFRSVYEVPSNVTAKVGFLRLVEGENETSGIDVFKATSAEVDMNAPVYDLQGRMVAPSYREAKGLQNGLYVVNGVKIIVK